MKIVFDAGVIISFSESCFLDIFKSLKNEIGEFIITKSVEFECVKKPEHNMRIRLGTLRIKDLIESKVFKLYDSNYNLDINTDKILELTNNMFYVKNKPLKIIHKGEAESLALLGLTKANYLAVDERTTRMLVEQPHALISIFKRKNKTKHIRFDEKKYMEFKKLIGNVNCIRSVDLFSFAYKKGILQEKFTYKDFLKSSLFSLKFNGCSVSFDEINNYIKDI